MNLAKVFTCLTALSFEEARPFNHPFCLTYQQATVKMKEKCRNLLKNELLIMLLNGVFAYTAFTAVIIMTLQIPPEAILDSGLQEIILVFEG